MMGSAAARAVAASATVRAVAPQAARAVHAAAQAAVGGVTILLSAVPVIAHAVKAESGASATLVLTLEGAGKGGAVSDSVRALPVGHRQPQQLCCRTNSGLAHLRRHRPTDVVDCPHSREPTTGHRAKPEEGRYGVCPPPPRATCGGLGARVPSQFDLQARRSRH
jgi:hypothetical protein